MVYEMAKDKNLLASSVLRWDEYDFVWSNGDPVPESVSRRMTNLCFDISESFDKHDEKAKFDGSIGNHFASA